MQASRVIKKKSRPSCGLNVTISAFAAVWGQQESDTVYVLKHDLERPGGCSDAYAQQFWMRWCGWGIRSRIEPLKTLTEKIKEYLPGVIAHCSCQLRTACRNGSTTLLRSSAEWPTADTMTSTSSSEGDRTSPQRTHEPHVFGIEGLPEETDHALFNRPIATATFMTQRMEYPQ